MGDIDNGYGETMPDEMTVTFYLNGETVVDVHAPLAGKWNQQWPEGKGAKIATAFTEMTYPFRTWLQPGQKYKLHTLDQVNHSFTFLDCGRWGGPAALGKPQRCFGIVWGSWTALCQFVPNSQNTPANYIQDKGARANNVINDVLDDLRGPNSSAKLIKSQWAFTPVSTPAIANLDSNTVYVILPDMHLPITSGPPANVTYTLPGGEMQAPFDDVRMGRFEYPEVRMQPGKYVLDRNDGTTYIDTWFRRYQAGDIFGGPTGSAAIDLTVFMDLLGKCRMKDRIHFVQVGDMYDLWIGLDCFFDQRADHVVHTGDRNGVTPEDFCHFWVDRTNKVFPGMMTALGSAVVGQKSWLWGNHDNYLAAHTPAGMTGARRIKEIRKGGIYIEHGQRGDPSNCDGETSGQSTTNTVFKYPFVRSFDPNRRDFFTTTAAISYIENPDFCVYAMGHTHSPFLTKLNIRFAKYQV